MGIEVKEVTQADIVKRLIELGRVGNSDEEAAAAGVQIAEVYATWQGELQVRRK